MFEIVTDPLSSSSYHLFPGPGMVLISLCLVHTRANGHLRRLSRANRRMRGATYI
jgi:hypothetical protein